MNWGKRLKCRRCRTVKPLEEYLVNSVGKQYRVCKPCMTRIGKESYAKSKAAVAETKRIKNEETMRLNGKTMNGTCEICKAPRYVYLHSKHSWMRLCPSCMDKLNRIAGRVRWKG